MENPFNDGGLYSVLVAGSLIVLSACNATSQTPGSAVTTPGTTGTITQVPAPVPSVTATPSPSPSQNVSNLFTGPAEVAPFVQQFVDDAIAQGRDVTPDMANPTLEIQIASLASYGSSVIGLCESGTNLRRVTFSPDYWNSADDTQKALLVHHELGHCTLYRVHTTALLASGEYASIMYPILMSDATYDGNSAYYLKELFSTQASSSAQGPAAGPNSITTYICNLSDLTKK